PAPVGVAPPPGAVVAPLDPGSDGWGPLGAQSSPPGWFFDVEVAYVFPNLNFKLTNDVPLPKTNETLNTPSVGLDSTVMPAFEIGYRLPESTGLFALSYSFLFAEGTGERPMLNVPSQVKTRGQVNWLDLDYGTVPYEFSPRYTINYRIGARIGDIYMDSTASNALRTESISSDFFGAGPHARMDIERRIVPLPGLALYGRLDGVVYVGQVKQKAQLSLANPGGQVINDSFYVRRTQTSPYGNLQAGLSYSPPAIPALKLTLGYLIESYWNVGRLGTDGATGISASRGQLWSQGAFLRGQWDF
ncbi:MAG: Lpg1974 family pore-forming outer membrane protein, partial [Gemmataceae bacterium]